MSDEPEVRLTLKTGDSSLVLSRARSEIVARGRRDVAALLEGVCNKCGESARLALAGCVCARCSEALDRNWATSTETDWVLAAFRGPEPEGMSRSHLYMCTAEGLSERWINPDQLAADSSWLPFLYLFVNTTYAEMKSHWATCDPSDSLCIGKNLEEFVLHAVGDETQDYYRHPWPEMRLPDVVPYIRPATGRDIYRAPAELGNAKAQYLLGLDYWGDPDGASEEDFAHAARWYRKAAQRGHSEAQWCLGDMYHTAAFAEEAAAANRTCCHIDLNIEGAMRATDLAVADELAEAAKWFRRAAEQGHPNAQFNLGVAYDNGEGVPKDYIEAIKWYRSAAEQRTGGEGTNRAKLCLGLLYEYGRGVEQDYVQAFMWMSLAAAAYPHWSDQRYAAARDALAAKMNTHQIAEAQRLAGAWEPRP